MPALRKGFREFFRSVENTISTHNMFQPNDSVLVGVSGGPDSVALLHILCEIAPRYSLRLGVAHLNHSLREKDSDGDAQFVEALARTLALPCYIEKMNVLAFQQSSRLSLEEAARRIRYRFFNDVAEKYHFDKIALGHHSDDNAELILMHLFRGSGPLGLSGIPPVRNGRIVRPLLRVSKSQLVEFLSKNGFRYVIDKSNTDFRHLRNRIRHDLLPHLKTQYNPRISETLNRFAAIARGEEEWIEQLVAQISNQWILSIDADNAVLSVSKMSESHAALKKRIIRRVISLVKGNTRGIASFHIEAVLKLVEVGPRFGSLDLPGRISIHRNDDTIRVSKNNFPRRKPDSFPIDFGLEGLLNEQCAFQYQIHELGVVDIKEAGVRLAFSKHHLAEFTDVHRSGGRIAFFDMATLHFPMIIRNVLPGDRFTPLGMTGTQKLKNFFINNKVPRSERLRCPVVVNKGKIIWVVGHRIDDAVKVTPSTANVLKVELFLA